MILKQVQGYPLYVKGNIKILDRIQLVLTTTIQMPKSIPISVPFVPKFKQITPLLEPIIHLQTIDEATREQIVKGKYHLKPETLYVYYPSEFRVDQKVYNMLDEVPRNIRPFVLKLLIWEQGKGQHSIEMQKLRINESLCQIAKQLIEAKLNSLSNEIKQYQSQPTTAKSLLHIFVLKNKLACLYAHLELNTFACDLLTDVWNQVMINFRCIMKLPPSTKQTQKLDFPQDIPRSPYTFSSTNDILGYFESSTQSTGYLRIVTHVFLNLYLFNLSLKQKYEAISKLKLFLDYVLNHVLVLARRTEWNKQQAMSFEIARNIWAIEVILKCLAQMQNFNKQGSNKQSTQKMNSEEKGQNVQQFKRLYVSVSSMLRNSIERIGFVLYSFDNYSIFPANLQRQLKFISDKIRNVKQPWKNYKKSIQSISDNEEQGPVKKSVSFYKRQQFSLEVPQQGPNGVKLRELLSKKFIPPEDISKILINFQSYTQVYLKILQIMYSSLKSSPFIRVAQSLKLTIQRANIMLGDWLNHQQYEDEASQFKEVWPQLQSLQKLYRLYFTFVRVLSGLAQKQVLCTQMSAVLKNKELQDEKTEILKICSNIHQILEQQKLVCSLSTLTQIEIHQNLTLSFNIKNSQIEQILKKPHKFFLETEQLMLADGIRRYELSDIKYRQYKKCSKCIKQCSNLCQEKYDTFLQITAKIIMQNVKQKVLFYIKSIVIKLPIENQEPPKQLTLYLQLSKQLQARQYKINTPKLLLQDESQQMVFSEIWTPFVFHLSNFVESVVLHKLEVNINSDCFSVQLQSRKSKEKEPQNLPEMKKPPNKIIISEDFCLKHNQNQLTYYKVNQNLDLNIDMENEQEKNSYVLTIFLKGQKPQKIQRNSKRKIQHHNTQQILVVSATFVSLKLNKQYVLSCQTKSLILLPLLSVQYHIVQTNQQFMLTNLRQIKLTIDEKLLQNQKNEDNLKYELNRDQSLSLVSRVVGISAAEYQKMSFLLDLNEWFDSQHLLQQENNTFKIWYQTHHKYTFLKPIQIESELAGFLNLPYFQEASQDFELAGKTHGEVEYIKDKRLNLWVIPTRPGNIMLPEIWINGKRGIWINSMITNIQPS